MLLPLWNTILEIKDLNISFFSFSLKSLDLSFATASLRCFLNLRCILALLSTGFEISFSICLILSVTFALFILYSSIESIPFSYASFILSSFFLDFCPFLSLTVQNYEKNRIQKLFKSSKIAPKSCLNLPKFKKTPVFNVTSPIWLFFLFFR